jgi:hypothetical protein
MTPQTLVHLVGTVLIHWAAAAGVASVVAHLRVRWWDTEMGRHLMAYMSAVALVLLLSCVVNDVGDSSWFQVLRLVVFVAIPLVMTWRLWLQLKAQRPGESSTTPIGHEREGDTT